MSYQLQINEKYKNFEKDLINIKNIFKQSNHSIHKARNELKIIEINGIKCVVKSFKIPHFLNRIAYSFFRDGKAKKSFINATKLLQLGVSTPEAIGTIEFFKTSLLTESYFISLYEPYDFTIREVFHHKVNEVKTILQQFTQFTYNLHQQGVWHVDYSLGNILITKQKTQYKFSIVDINRMQFKRITPDDGLRNFNKFWAKDKNDLIIIAKEYAKLSDFNEKKSIDIIQEEANFLEMKTKFKRKVKGK